MRVNRQITIVKWQRFGNKKDLMHSAWEMSNRQADGYVDRDGEKDRYQNREQDTERDKKQTKKNLK